MSERLKSANKLVKMASIAWVINLFYVMASLWGHHYSKSFGGWQADPLNVMFLCGCFAKVVLTITFVASLCHRQEILEKGW